MPSSKSTEKVSISFTNWVLGGSLVSLTSTDSERRHRRVSGRQVLISDVDSNDDEITVKQGENPKIEKKHKKDGDGGDKKDGKKKDGDADKDKSREKKKCKSCGKDKDCGENDKGGKKDGDDKSKKDDEDKTKKEGRDDSKKDDGDGEKKGEEKKSDESKDKSDSGGGAGFSDDQISKLKEMKAANKSWKEIAAELKVNPKDCKEKWKELQSSGKDKPDSGDAGKGEEKAGHSGGGSTGNAGGGGNSGGQTSTWKPWNGGGGDKPAETGQSNGWDSAAPADAPPLDFGGLFDDPPKESEKPTTSNWGGAPTDQPNRSDGGKKNKGKKKDKGQNQNQNSDDSAWDNYGAGVQTQNQNTGGSGWHNSDHDQHQNSRGSGWHKDAGSSSPKENPGNDGGGWGNNDSNQPPKQSENQSRLQPNEIWSKEDCEVLEMMERRYLEHKWLHVKAGFYNWTGRMVSEDLIEKKFKYDGVA